MKKILLSSLFAVTISVSAFAQAVLPTSWGFTNAILPTGWTSSGTGFAYYGASGNPAPSAKFAVSNDMLTIDFTTPPGNLVYDVKGNTANSAAYTSVFLVEESVNGTTWTTLHSHTSMSITAYTTITDVPQSTTRHIRFNLSVKASGNISLDNVSIAAGVSTAALMTVKQGTTTILNGGTYTLGSPVSTLLTTTFTVQNLGTVSALNITAAALTGVAAADYSVLTGMPMNVPASGSGSLVVIFTPSVAGTRNAMLSLTNNDVTANPYVINLNGVGGNLATEPTAQATNMTFPIIKSYHIQGLFTAASPAPDGYLVIRKTGSASTDVPTDGKVYQRGDSVGTSKVIYSSSLTGFFPNDIIANTNYYFTVFSYNGVGTYRNYLTTGPLAGTVTSAGSMQPATYYNGISTSSPTFVTDLHALTNPHTLQFYSSYGPLFAATFFTRDTTANQRVITCAYSGENKVYSEPFDWTTVNFSREHTYCQSWQPTVNDPLFQNRPEYNDYHMITPTNQIQVNGIRSNNPLGVVVGTPLSSYLGSKIGLNAAGKKVFEPRDSDKGDAARCMMYQCIAYTGVPYTGAPNTNAVYGGSWSLPSYISNAIPYGQDPDVLKTWNTQDPPDNFEIARNDYVDSLQGNRNPFIDHPEYVCYINFGNMAYSPCGPTGIAENRSDDFIAIYPNPNSGSFMMNYACAKNEIISVTLVDLMGRVVYTNELQVNKGSNSIEMNLQNLTRGIYLFELINGNGKQTQKLVIQ